MTDGHSHALSSSTAQRGVVIDSCDDDSPLPRQRIEPFWQTPMVWRVPLARLTHPDGRTEGDSCLKRLTLRAGVPEGVGYWVELCRDLRHHLLQDALMRDAGGVHQGRVGPDGAT